MTSEVKLNEKGKERFSLSHVIVGNIIMIIWLTLGSTAVWFFSQTYFPVYAAFIAVVYLCIALLLVYIVLRKIVCTNCYYYDKWCSLGWGKLAALLFKQGKLEQFNESVGLKLAPLIYGILTIIPFILIIISLVVLFDFYKIGVLILLIIFSGYSAGLGRKIACSSCKMNTYCKGSVVKQ
jgi:hypothetical protein